MTSVRGQGHAEGTGCANGRRSSDSHPPDGLGHFLMTSTF
jgi:hypothetical protein